MTILSHRLELLSVLTLLFAPIHCTFAFVIPVKFRQSSRTHLYDSAIPSRMPAVKESTHTGLANKTVFLTGASGGLGTALALQLADCGVKCLILSARKADALRQVTEQCLQINDKIQVHTLVCDLSDPKQVKTTAADAVKLGPVDVLINNGGVSSRSPFLETDLSVDEMVSGMLVTTE